MLPISNNASSEALPHKKPKIPSELLDRKNTFNSAILQPILHHHPRIWLLLSILSVQVLLLLTLRSVPVSLSLPHPHTHTHTTHTHDDDLHFQPPQPSNSTSTDPQDQCGLGRVYVYDLPAAFNAKILANCDWLNSWTSRCDTLENGGLGLVATKLAKIVLENLAPEWYWTNQFLSKIIFHN